MEENITQQRTTTINITVVCDLSQQKGLAEELSAFIAPDGKEARECVFKTLDLASVQPGNFNGADIVLIAAEEDNETADKLAATLTKAGTLCARVAGNGNEKEKIKETVLNLEKALDLGFTIADFAQIQQKGVSMEKVRSQLVIFKNGIQKIVLGKPATIGDGIYPMSKAEAIESAAFFDSKKDNYELKKFVPASGAASRMFKFLVEFLAEYNPEKESLNAYMNRQKDSAMKVFLVGIDKFPFFKEILEETKKDPQYSEWNKDFRYYNFVKTMLAPGRFDYANKPKGVLPFHQYEDFIATPVYEHLKESTAYASSNGQAHVHFTISDEHLDSFLDCIKEVKDDVERESGIEINFSFSSQMQETDTLAVDNNNAPFRNNDGSLLFRPGGHGALIDNLNKLDADIVCIKNIDNVSHNNINIIALYKKALLGVLIKLREQLFSYLEKLDADDISEQDISEIHAFAKEKLFIDIPADISKFTLEHRIQRTRELLNRPLRVCGMVKNEGEPGGGPFWITDNGRSSLQIVESSQIDLDNKQQNQIFSNSTHFNPVDLVCSLKNYKGEGFDLKSFVDPSTGFIVYKNKMGKDVKSYELPGLWNGAMAEWITIFVEVPLDTFSPVKTVNDLLKPAHQPH